MDISQIVTIVIILLLLGLLTEPLARWLGLPYSMMLVAVGYIFSEIFTGYGYDTGIRAYNFHDLIFYVFLPILIFESAYKIDIKLLLQNSGTILLLAIFGMLLTTFVTAAGLFYGIAHSKGFPWEAALLCGALLAATDPVAVVAQLKALGAPKRLGMLLEGESLFNDATAIVVFSVFLSIALMPANQFSPTAATVEFARIFLGGMGIGLITGSAGVLLLRGFSNSLSQRVLTLVAAYASYLLAEITFHVSGVMATLITGLMFAWGSRKYTNQSTQQWIDSMWELIAHIATALVFLVTGITVFLDMFIERWLAMLIAIGSVVAARTLSIYIILPLASLFSKDPVPKNYRMVMVWGGLRGAVTLALAFSLPHELDYWWTIQSIAFGVVIFTLFIQAPTNGWLIKTTLRSPS